MSWLEKLLPPKIQPTDPAERRTVPEGLWIKCPSCETVLYKTDLEQNLNVCPKCDHHHRIGARAARRLPRPRRPLGDRPGGAAGRRAEVQGQQEVPRAPEGRARDHRRDRRAGGHGRRGDERAAGGGLLRVRLHGRLDGLGGRRALRARRRGRHRAEGALRQLHRHRRRAHAGRPAEPAADGQDQRRAHAPGQGPAALHQRADRPHHGRRLGQLRLHGRRGHRRAQGADRLRRPARDREHRAREAARGLPAQRVPARQGRARHDRRPPPAAPTIARLLAMLQRQSADAVA
jgi:hypothetical protein